jgi:hypothetical protein
MEEILRGMNGKKKGFTRRAPRNGGHGEEGKTGK